MILIGYAIVDAEYNVARSGMTAKIYSTEGKAKAVLKQRFDEAKYVVREVFVEECPGDDYRMSSSPYSNHKRHF